MKKHFINILISAMILVIVTGCSTAVLGHENVGYKDTSNAIALELKDQRQGLALIAHAGAAIEGWEGSNSLEAMQNAVALGFRYIELDMLTSSDGEIVLTHLWYHISNRIPGITNGIMTHAEFMDHQLFSRFTTVDLDGLIEFLRENPGPRIITDTKDTDYAALYAIAERFPQYKHRFIVQAYSFESVARIRALGFEDIILTLYMMPLDIRDPGAIHQFAVNEGLYAVAMPMYHVVPSFVDHLNLDEMRYIVHTIDSAAEAAMLYDMGFYAIYTGFLKYGNNSGIVEVPLPVESHVNRIAANIRGLDAVPAAMFYKIGATAYVRDGEAAPMRENLMSTPFESPITRQIYLPARHFERYTEKMDWNHTQRVLHITRDGNDYGVHGTDYQLFIYRDMLFISEAVVNNIFPFEVLRRGDYIIVVYEHHSNATINDLFEIAETLFSNTVIQSQIQPWP
ncbi:MAG: hypothetical protein FWC76_00350 [Defluviitaleaceae bacterium]|nr:hypothetical protein [Defluviitaleaceae bacterium]